MPSLAAPACSQEIVSYVFTSDASLTAQLDSCQSCVLKRSLDIATVQACSNLTRLLDVTVPQAAFATTPAVELTNLWQLQGSDTCYHCTALVLFKQQNPSVRTMHGLLFGTISRLCD